MKKQRKGLREQVILCSQVRSLKSSGAANHLGNDRDFSESSLCNECFKVLVFIVKDE